MIFMPDDATFFFHGIKVPRKGVECIKPFIQVILVINPKAPNAGAHYGAKNKGEKPFSDGQDMHVVQVPYSTCHRKHCVYMHM